MLKHNLFQLDKVFQGEQGRGVVTSITSGVLSNGLVYFGQQALGMSIETSATIFGLGFGNILGYFADIMFAKQNFDISGKIVQLPFNAFGKKFSWLIKSLISKSFFRFWIIVFIDMIMTITIVGYMTKYFDKYELFMYGWRDAAIVLAFAIGSFLVYVNPLRFTWAYNSHEDPTMNMLILMWFTISLLIYVSMKRQTMELEDKNEAEDKEADTDPSSQIQKLLNSTMPVTVVPVATESASKVMSGGQFSPTVPPTMLQTVPPVTRPPKEVHSQEIQGHDSSQKYQPFMTQD